MLTYIFNKILNSDINKEKFQETERERQTSLLRAEYAMEWTTEGWRGMTTRSAPLKETHETPAKGPLLPRRHKLLSITPHCGLVSKDSQLCETLQLTHFVNFVVCNYLLFSCSK